MVVLDLRVALVAVDAGVPVGRDRAHFHRERVLRALEVVDSVVVTSAPVVLFSAAADISAGQAKPEVFREFAVRAVREMLGGECLGDLLKNQTVFAGEDI